MDGQRAASHTGAVAHHTYTLPGPQAAPASDAADAAAGLHIRDYDPDTDVHAGPGSRSFARRVGGVVDTHPSQACSV